MRRLLVLLSAVAMFAGAQNAMASAAGALKMVDVGSSEQARQRGAEIVVSTCMMCHSLKYIKFSDLKQIGMTEEQILSLLEDQSIDDRMLSLTSIEVRKESYGKVPPDLSLMAIARQKGPQHIYTLLTGYYYKDAEQDETDNHLFPGIKMPDVLAYADAESDEERAEVEAQAHDVASFLVWAADPSAESRRTIGVYVILYLIILTALLYMLKRRIWRKLH
ncbi:MAG TPA: cytochrome C [Candidatus Tenderia electrophaga]|uniref:Cytochrome C n=1 Tax=Candidatus Tenderia electrophaga TaxID=1748243 RepID=A0A832N5K6_9GAMM|nr:cytochrome C [Candidatus Tenderia electrophaga]